MFLPFLISHSFAQNCISLKDSKYCSEYASNSVLSEVSKFDTVEQFNQFIERGMLFQFGSVKCKQWPRMDTSIPLHTSFTCAFAVNMSKQCNNSPRRMCKSSLMMVLKEVKSRIEQHCPNTLNDEQFKVLERYVETAKDDDCYLAVGPDASKKCGMEDDKAMEFCTANPNELCCVSSSNLVPAAKDVATKGSSAATTTNEETQGVNPMFVGIGGIGIGLIILIAAILFFVFKKRPVKAAKTASVSAAGLPNTNQDVKECIYAYNAALGDEIDLRIGDSIRVYEKYNDGWAYGYNQTTQRQGVFPIDCLEGSGNISKRYTSHRQSEMSSRYTRSTFRRSDFPLQERHTFRQSDMTYQRYPPSNFSFSGYEPYKPNKP